MATATEVNVGSQSLSTSSSTSFHPTPQTKTQHQNSATLKGFLQRANFINASFASPRGDLKSSFEPPSPQTEKSRQPFPHLQLSQVAKEVQHQGPSSNQLHEQVDCNRVSQHQNHTPYALPVAALPFTLRSSSLRPSAKQSDNMAGPHGGLGASRFARGDSTQKDQKNESTALAPLSLPSADVSITCKLGRNSTNFNISKDAPTYGYTSGVPDAKENSVPSSIKVDDSDTSKKSGGISERLASLRAMRQKATTATGFNSDPVGNTSPLALHIKQRLSEPPEAIRIKSDALEKSNPVFGNDGPELRAVTETVPAHCEAEANLAAENQAELERLARETAEEERIAGEKVGEERIAREKAEAERAEAERLAKEKTENDRRAKLQADINAINAKINALENQEKARLASVEDKIRVAEQELLDAQGFHAEVLGEHINGCTLLDVQQQKKKKVVENVARLDAEVSILRSELIAIELFIPTVRENAEQLEAQLASAKELLQDAKCAVDSVNATNNTAEALYNTQFGSYIAEAAYLNQILEHPAEFSDVLVSSSTSVVVAELTRFAEPNPPVPDVNVVLPTPVTKMNQSINTYGGRGHPGPVLDLCGTTASSANDNDLRAPNRVTAARNGTSLLNPRATIVLPNGLPKPAPRAPSEIIQVQLMNIPTTNNINGNVARLVWGGPILKLTYEVGQGWALIKFLKAEDCKKYLAATDNGIPWPEEQARVIVTKPCDSETGERDAINRILRSGATRCIRIVNVEEHWTQAALHKVAEKQERKLVRLLNGHDAQKRRIVDFHFFSIGEAITFKGQMERDDEFTMCKIAFGTDPAAVATGVQSAIPSSSSPKA